MDNNELIFKLVNMLNSTKMSQTACCGENWIEKWIEKWIENGKTVKNVTAPPYLADRAKLLSPFILFDKSKLKYYLFAPVYDNRWKVFALDLKGIVLSQLEDYEGEITDENNNKIKERFFIKA